MKKILFLLAMVFSLPSSFAKVPSKEDLLKITFSDETPAALADAWKGLWQHYGDDPQIHRAFLAFINSNDVTKVSMVWDIFVNGLDGNVIIADPDSKAQGTDIAVLLKLANFHFNVDKKNHETLYREALIRTSVLARLSGMQEIKGSPEFLAFLQRRITEPIYLYFEEVSLFTMLLNNLSLREAILLAFKTIHEGYEPLHKRAYAVTFLADHKDQLGELIERTQLEAVLARELTLRLPNNYWYREDNLGKGGPIPSIAERGMGEFTLQGRRQGSVIDQSVIVSKASEILGISWETDGIAGNVGATKDGKLVEIQKLKLSLKGTLYLRQGMSDAGWEAFEKLIPVPSAERGCLQNISALLIL